MATQSFVPEDVMKLFAQSFSSGASAIEGAGRLALAAQGQAQDFALGTQKLALQNQELQQQASDNAAKIALNRENISADAAVKGQEINMRQQQLAKEFMLREHEMENDKLNFAEKIRGARAAEEAQRIALAANVDKVEESNKIERAKLDIEREKVRAGVDYKELGRLKDEQDHAQATQFRKMTFLAQSLDEVRKEAKEPNTGLTKKEFLRKDGSDDEDKMYEIAKARTNRLMDSTGGSVQSYPAREEKKVDTTVNSQQTEKPKRELGILDLATEITRKQLKELNSGETVTVDGKVYRKR